MNKPREKWVILSGGAECPCQHRINLESKETDTKICFYHEKLSRRWDEWNNRPAPVEPGPRLPFADEAIPDEHISDD